MNKTDWIIAIGNSAVDGVIINKFNGTEDEVEGLLLRLVAEDKENDESYDYGTETVDDIENNGDGKLNAYATYSDYHINYTARRLDKVNAL